MITEDHINTSIYFDSFNGIKKYVMEEKETNALRSILAGNNTHLNWDRQTGKTMLTILASLATSKKVKFCTSRVNSSQELVDKTQNICYHSGIPYILSNKRTIKTSIDKSISYGLFNKDDLDNFDIIVLDEMFYWNDSLKQLAIDSLSGSNCQFVLTGKKVDMDVGFIET